MLACKSIFTPYFNRNAFSERKTEAALRPRDKNLIFVHFDVIIPSEASLLARACERHISTEIAVCGTQSAGQRKLPIKFQFYLVSMLFIMTVS